MMKRTLISIGLLGLAACVSDPHHSAPVNDPPPPDPKAAVEQAGEVHLDLIREMLDKGEYYAALAHLQDAKLNSAPGNSELKLLEADTRRHLGQTQNADLLYRQLLAGPQAGAAYHGLGLLYVQSNLPFAVANLRRASQLSPTDPDIRNDLGRALMESGRYAEAMPELSTAAELAPGQIKSRNNLIILMLVMGNESAASQLAQQSSSSPTDLQQMRIQAQKIKAAQTPKAAPAAG